MEKRKSLILKIILYSIYGVAFFVFITIWRFPYHLLTKQLDTFIQKEIPGATVTIKKLTPSFPLGANLRSVGVGYGENEILYFDLVEANLDLWPLTPILTRHYPLGFTARGPGTNLSGRTTFYQTGAETILDIESRIESLDLTRIPPLRNLNNLSLAGIISGDLLASLSFADKKIDNGEIVINLSGGSLTDINLMGFKINKLDYEKITVQISVENGKANVKQMELLSKEVVLNVLGEVLLNQNLPLSPVNLLVKIKPTPNLLKELGIPPVLLKKNRDKEGNITMRIAGTFSQPRIDF